MAATIGTGISKAVVITAHAPHGGIKFDVVSKWWDSFSEFTDKATGDGSVPVYVVGDLNAPAVGKHSLGVRTKHTDLLEGYANRHSLVVANVNFTKATMRLVTFMNHNRKAQLDCVLVSARWASSVENVHSVAPFIPSDHRPLSVRIRLHLKAKQQASVYAAKPIWSALSDEDTKDEFLQEMKQFLFSRQL